MLKILVDENIPFGSEAFSEFGEVQLAAGRDITNSMLKQTDLLIIRSVTKVNSSLLKNTPVKFVGSTTIGLDHIDTGYLRKNNISFANAPGCNAYSVAEYIMSILIKLASEQDFDLKTKSLGIIGYGNIGTKAAKFAEALGMTTLINDPPLKRKTGDSLFVSYEEALNADIITYHVPLNMKGIDKTYHMLSAGQLKKFDDRKIIINASRGPVISNDDLKAFLLKNGNTVILDVWEDEPRIDADLLNLLKFASAHIAGYSLEGKVNGTIMIYDELCRFLNTNPSWQPVLPPVAMPLLDYPEGENLEIALNKIISAIYNIEDDNNRLRKISELQKNDQGLYFDYLRKNYPIRREFPNYTIRINRQLPTERKLLESLRFHTITE